MCFNGLYACDSAVNKRGNVKAHFHCECQSTRGQSVGGRSVFRPTISTSIRLCGKEDCVENVKQLSIKITTSKEKEGKEDCVGRKTGKKDCVENVK